MIIECPECGTKNTTDKPIQPGKKYRCGKCGTMLTLLQTDNAQSDMTSRTTTEAPENTSGQGSLAVIPKEIVGWNWGAFLLSWIWGLGNNVWVALLALIPFVSFIMSIVLGIKGNEWAWRNKRWDSIEHFNRIQRNWTGWGLGLFIIPWALGIILAVIIPNVGRFIGAGEEEAMLTEFANIQAAVHAVMVDNELSILPHPVIIPTNNMGAFPDATSVCGIDKLTDSYGNTYQMHFDKDGYVLYQHDVMADGSSSGLVNYVTTSTSTYWYTVDANGRVTQYDDN